MDLLLWLDLETTGLNHNVDKILQIACVLTDTTTNTVYFSKDYVIKCDQTTLQQMDEWCIRQHTASGLCAKALNSTSTIQEVELDIINNLNLHVAIRNTVYLAGNSVHFDKSFLTSHMPTLSKRLSHRILDVSSVSLFVKHNNEEVHNSRPQKQHLHTAMEDILESIEEYRYYIKELGC